MVLETSIPFCIWATFLAISRIICILHFSALGSSRHSDARNGLLSLSFPVSLTWAALHRAKVVLEPMTQHHTRYQHWMSKTFKTSKHAFLILNSYGISEFLFTYIAFSALRAWGKDKKILSVCTNLTKHAYGFNHYELKFVSFKKF
jgi:hypothetical protein